MKKGKPMKPVTLLLTICIMLLMSTSAFAISTNSTPPKGSDVLTDSSVISPNSTSLPTVLWNIATQGGYYFTGTSTSQTLYSNYKFKGKTTYHLHVFSAKAITVKVKNRYLPYTYSTKNIAANTIVDWDVFGNGMTASTEIYIEFSGSYMDFNGTIK